MNSERSAILDSASPWELADLSAMGLNLPTPLTNQTKKTTPVVFGPENATAFEAALMARRQQLLTSNHQPATSNE